MLYFHDSCLHFQHSWPESPAGNRRNCLIFSPDIWPQWYTHNIKSLVQKVRCRSLVSVCLRLYISACDDCLPVCVSERLVWCMWCLPVCVSKRLIWCMWWWPVCVSERLFWCIWWLSVCVSERLFWCMWWLPVCVSERFFWCMWWLITCFCLRGYFGACDDWLPVFVWKVSLMPVMIDYLFLCLKG